MTERHADADASAATELLLDNPRFWAPRQRINVASLAHKVGEARLKEACPVLSRFLAEQSVLEQLQYLPDVIRLQSLLIKNFAKTLESSTVRALTSTESQKGLSCAGSKAYLRCIQCHVVDMTLDAPKITCRKCPLFQAI